MTKQETIYAAKKILNAVFIFLFEVWILLASGRALFQIIFMIWKISVVCGA